jgi:hypothetical protein
LNVSEQPHGLQDNIFPIHTKKKKKKRNQEKGTIYAQKIATTNKCGEQGNPCVQN